MILPLYMIKAEYRTDLRANVAQASITLALSEAPDAPSFEVTVPSEIVATLCDIALAAEKSAMEEAQQPVRTSYMQPYPEPSEQVSRRTAPTESWEVPTDMSDAPAANPGGALLDASDIGRSV